MRNGKKSFGKVALLLLGGMAGLAVLLPGAEAASFPREGNVDIPNGVAAPFAGSWWIGFPEGEGMINGEPIVTCAAPVELSAESPEMLRYTSPRGTQTSFELFEFSGRTTWFVEGGESTIAVWVSADEFFAYSVDLLTGKARWDSPIVYRRC
ncbi:hypothetical protein [Devosia sp.]|uniref:hypothetical protein n=1 Tax=Devosia sp. TaxID=1871048 RepID=UPI002AFDEC40|nr:hypothetical protein [Devosia sp.]